MLFLIFLCTCPDHGSYRRGSTRRAMSVEILSTAARQLYDKLH